MKIPRCIYPPSECCGSAEIKNTFNMFWQALDMNLDFNNIDNTIFANGLELYSNGPGGKKRVGWQYLNASPGFWIKDTGWNIVGTSICAVHPDNIDGTDLPQGFSIVPAVGTGCNLASNGTIVSVSPWNFSGARVQLPVGTNANKPTLNTGEIYIPSDKNKIYINDGNADHVVPMIQTPINKGLVRWNTDQFEAVPWVVERATTNDSHTGDTNFTTLRTIAVPASTITEEGQILKIVAWFVYTGTNPIDFSLRWAGAEFGAGITTITPPASPCVVCLEAELIFDTADTSDSYHSLTKYIFEGMAGGVVGTLTTEQTTDFTSAQNLTINVQLSNAADSVVLKSYSVGTGV